MRIGMFSWESLYSIKVGGIAPHVSELSEALAKRSHEIHVFTRRGDFDSYEAFEKPIDRNYYILLKLYSTLDENTN